MKTEEAIGKFYVPKGRDENALTFAMAWVRHHDRYSDDYVVDPKATDVSPKDADSSCCSQEDHS